MNKLNKFNKFFDKCIYIFLICSPIIDSLTAIFVNKFDLSFSIGTIIRGIFVILSLIWLKYNTNSRKIILLFLLYSLLAIMYFFGLNKNIVFTEITNIFHIFYLPIMMLLFSKYNNEKINDKLIVKTYLLYLNLIIIPYIFNIGFNLSDSYSNKIGYFGLFYGGNEISAILVGLSAIVLNYVNNSKNYILKIVTYIELFICTYLIGTKTLFIGIILVIIFLFIRYIKYSRVSKVDKNRKLVFLSVFIIILLVAIIPFTPMMKNIKTTLNYYDINKVSDTFTIENIDNLVFSKRLSNLSRINKEFSKGKIKTIIYGLGNAKIESIKVIEIDILDIFYSIGVFGIIIYLFFIFYTKMFKELKDKYRFSFILFILMSLFSGHVLIKPMVSIYIALLFILSRNSLSIEKKRILLVSNMYPSNKYKHYGSFVKNTEEILLDNGFIVDKVVMTKQNEKIAKLFSYIRLHSLVILKSIFNNYDYIYVHFISHSGLGPVIVKKISHNVKLVFNAHGNDVVRDLKEEEKNVERSRKYIKYADKIVVPSKFMKQVIIDEYKFDEEKIFIYPSGGVKTDLFTNIPKDVAKKEAKLNKEFNYIGYISRIEKNKGWDLFLKAIKELEKNNEIKNTKFLIVGSGVEEEKMMKMIDDLKIIDYLEIRNMVSQEELVYLYNSLDIFVFPTYRKESLGLVGLEAMACETLVIASKNYGPADYVIDNKNGMFFKPKDYKDLANKILEMKKLNNEKVKKMKKKARETAIRYDSNNTKELILDVFK